MSVVSLASLMVIETKAAIYKTALQIATAVGLPVSSWTAGDPTRSLYHLEAEVLSTLENVVAGFISSGFLDYATDGWLKIRAKQDFNVDVPEATFATCDVVLTNAGGGVYDLDPGDLTLKSTISGKTYRNTTGGHLAGASTLTVTVVGDEAGSDSSAGAGEIDDLVTGLLGVTCSNTLAAIGIDEQDKATTIQQCRDKIDSLSPNGPSRIYAYVARNAALTGASGITRVRVYPYSDTGDVVVYLAGPSGGASEPDRLLVEAAYTIWATPLCVTVTTLAAVNAPIDVTYELWVYKSVNKTADEVKADVLSALERMIAQEEIGGDIIPPATTGKVYLSIIESTIRNAFPDHAFRVVVSTPTGDTALANNEVPALGTVTGTVNLVVDA